MSQPANTCLAHHHSPLPSPRSQLDQQRIVYRRSLGRLHRLQRQGTEVVRAQQGLEGEKRLQVLASTVAIEAEADWDRLRQDTASFLEAKRAPKLVGWWGGGGGRRVVLSCSIPDVRHRPGSSCRPAPHASLPCTPISPRMGRRLFSLRWAWWPMTSGG